MYGNDDECLVGEGVMAQVHTSALQPTLEHEVEEHDEDCECRGCRRPRRQVQRRRRS